MIDQVLWKDIFSFEGIYKISNSGQVKSMTRMIDNGRGSLTLVPEKILKPIMNKIGYPMVSLRLDGRIENCYIHRLVCQHFLTNKDNLTHVNHIDNIKTNNNYTNLEWCTQKHNVNHALKIGVLWTGSKATGSFLSIGDIIKIKYLLLNTELRQYKIAEMFKVNQSHISRIKNDLAWRYEINKHYNK